MKRLLILALLFIPSLAVAQWGTPAATTSSSGCSSGTGTSCAVTVATTTAGHAAVAIVWNTGATFPSAISGGCSGSWTSAASSQTTASSLSISDWYCLNTSAGSSVSVAATVTTGTGVQITFLDIPFSGVIGFDISASGGSVSCVTTCASPSITPNTATDLVIEGFYGVSGVSATSINSGYTLVASSVEALAYQTGMVAGTATAPTWTTSSGNALLNVIGLRLLPNVSTVGGLVSDNFTRAACSSPCGLGGGFGLNWAIIQGTWTISSNLGILSAAPGNSNPVWWSADSFNNDQYASATLVSFSATTTKVGPAVRVQGSSSQLSGGTGSTKSGYYAYCSAYTPTHCTSMILAKDSGDTVTTLATFSTLTIANGTEVTLKVVGTTLSLWNGSISSVTQIGTNTTDSTFSSGYPGMMAFNTFTTANGVSYWEGGNIPSATRHKVVVVQ